jgi:hypothetical protein
VEICTVAGEGEAGRNGGQQRRRKLAISLIYVSGMLAVRMRSLRACAQLCPKLCPRGAITHPKPPPVTQLDKEKPLGKSMAYRGVSIWEEDLNSRGHTSSPTPPFMIFYFGITTPCLT